MSGSSIIVHQKAVTGDPRRRSYKVNRRAGREGNLQTLRIMASLVRRDVQDLGLRDYAARLVQDVPGHSHNSVADELFYFARDRIKYRRDPFSFEVIADARKSLSLNYGDCGDKTVLLATLWGCLGIKSRFVVLSYAPPAFQHVFLEARLEGKWLPYDPTPEEAVPGWQSKGLQRATFPIFDKGDKNDPTNLADFMGSLLGTGIGAVVGAAVTEAAHSIVTKPATPGPIQPAFASFGVSAGAGDDGSDLADFRGGLLGAGIGAIGGLQGGPVTTAINAGAGFLQGLFAPSAGGTSESTKRDQFVEGNKMLADFARSLAAKPAVTAEEYQAFVGGLNQLSSFAAQSGSDWIKRYWQTEQPHWAGWPEKIAAKVVTAGGTGAGVGSGAGGMIGGADNSSLLLIVGGAGVGFLVLRSLLGRGR
jgi:hypothetical protein